jgi:CheY-like chemotaxis protein
MTSPTPTATASGSDAVKPASAAALAHLRLSALVVDDDSTNRMLLARMLLKLGFAEASTAENGAEALEKVAARAPPPQDLTRDLRPMAASGILDLLAAPGETRPWTAAVSDRGDSMSGRASPSGWHAVFMDNTMPVMSGIEATRRLRTGAVPYRGLIVAVTGDAQASVRDAFMAAGADIVLAKPVVQQALADVLRQHLLAPEAQPQVCSAPPHSAAVPGFLHLERDSALLRRADSSAEASAALGPAAEPQPSADSTAAPPLCVQHSVEPAHRLNDGAELSQNCDRALQQQQQQQQQQLAVSPVAAQAAPGCTRQSRPHAVSSDRPPPDFVSDEAARAPSLAASESADEHSTPVAARSESVLLSTMV